MADPHAKKDDALSAAQRSKIRRLSAPKEVEAADEAGELNIVPFLDIITNVLMFVLASITVSFTVTLDSDAPKGGAGKGVRPQADESLNLTVILGSDGYFIKGKGASIAPGCQGLGSGVTLPRVAASSGESGDGRKYDVDNLKKCVRKLKDEVEKAAMDQQVMITANPNVPFQEIVRVMDAVRKDERGDCCPPGPGFEGGHKPGEGCTGKRADEWTGPGCLFPKVVFTVLK